MKYKVGITITCIVVGSLFIIFSSVRKSTHVHYTLPEFFRVLQENPSSIKNRFMTVYGNVVEDSIYKQGTTAKFAIEQEKYTLNVFFTGKTLLPDTFQDGAAASIDGTYDFEKQLFFANKVLAKCASKYESRLEQYQK